MKTYLYLAAISTLPLVGCTTYPQNYTYSPSVSVGGDNQGGIDLPSPYATKPAPQKHNHYCAPTPLPRYVYDHNPYEYQEYDDTVYIESTNVRIKGEDGVWR